MMSKPRWKGVELKPVITPTLPEFYMLYKLFLINIFIKNLH